MQALSVTVDPAPLVTKLVADFPSHARLLDQESIDSHGPEITRVCRAALDYAEGRTRRDIAPRTWIFSGTLGKPLRFNRGYVRSASFVTRDLVDPNVWNNVAAPDGWAFRRNLNPEAETGLTLFVPAQTRDIVDIYAADAFMYHEEIDPNATAFLRIESGYASSAQVPARLWQAMLEYASGLFEVRESHNVAQAVSLNPTTTDYLDMIKIYNSV